jgi:hypothetical protein
MGFGTEPRQRTEPGIPSSPSREFLSGYRNPYSAFSAAVDPNRTTEMTIAAIDPDIQASE